MSKSGNKKRIAILAGGDSGEYQISINSATIIRDHLSTDKYDSYVIIVKKGDWIHEGDDGKQYIVDKNDFSLTMNEKITFDVAVNAIHGTPGENGLLSGYLEMIDIPYTSSDVLTSSLTFNKFVCNQLVSSWGVLTASSICLKRGDKFLPEEVAKELGLPCFVKPNNGGSSVATSRVNNADEIPAAVELAFKEDRDVIIESFIEGREITCGAFNYMGKMLVFPVTEIISKKDFFDFEAKYDPALADEITPADIPEAIELDCKATSAELYHKLNCRGVVRFDYIYNDSGMYFLEVNTIPGLSAESIVPKQAKEMGYSLEELFDMMIRNALEGRD